MTWVCLYGVVTYLQFQFTGNQLQMITQFGAFIPVSDVDIRGSQWMLGSPTLCHKTGGFPHPFVHLLYFSRD
jgi:hypothetical protein